jgi:predicted Zn-ribbon and HTH transcriptional regulator
MSTEVVEKAETIRQSIRGVLEEFVLNAREISGRVGASEKEVIAHLRHLERSLAHQSLKLVVVAARCQSCGFVFANRDRYGKPSKCPRCRATRVEAARFTIEQR